ncbi:DUF421 domain-containing protein [Orbaceae bacterium ac157xtp]
MLVLEMLPKFILAIVVLLIYVKLSGKSQTAPLSQLDQVGSMVIGTLVGGALLSTSVSALEATALVAVWAGLLILIRFIKSRNSKIRDAIDGKPVLLIKNGQLLSENFRKVKMNLRDFQTMINIQGVHNMSELKNVWYELNGSLTIVNKGDKDVSTLLIEDGVIDQDGLKQIKKSETWLKHELSEQKFHHLDEIFCAEYYDNKLKVYLKQEDELESLRQSREKKDEDKPEHEKKAKSTHDAKDDKKADKEDKPKKVAHKEQVHHAEHHKAKVEHKTAKKSDKSKETHHDAKQQNEVVNEQANTQKTMETVAGTAASRDKK